MMQMIGGRYEIVRNLGGGNFGATFVAKDRQLPGHPECVVKKFRPPPNSPPNYLEIAKKFFDKEAAVLYRLYRSLNSDRIPQLLAHFEENQEFYIVEELIQGKDLSQELRAGRLSEAQAIDLLQDVLETLAVMNHHRIVHLDIKPANLMRRDADGRIVLIDFGAVKELASQASAIATGQPQPAHRTVVCGTPGYMPPEQAIGHPQYSSDLYALGMTAIEALTQIPPNALYDPRSGEVVWRPYAKISDRLAQILDKMVQPNVKDRYPHAVAVLEDLKALLPPPTVPTSPPLPTGAPLGLPSLSPNPTSSSAPRSRTLKLAGVGVALATVCGAVWIAVNPCLLPGRCTVAGDPVAAQASLDRGNSLADSRDYTNALAAAEQARQLDPNDSAIAAQSWLLQGIALSGLNRLDDARQAFEKALTFNPSAEVGAKIWTEQGTRLIQQNQLQDALNAFDNALKQNPNEAIALSHRGWVLFQLGRSAEGATSLDKARAIAPDSAEVYIDLADVTFRTFKQPVEALKLYNRAIQLDPQSAVAYLGNGEVLLSLNRFSEARYAYEEVIQYQPDSAVAWYGKGVALEKLQQIDQAIAAYSKAIEFQPNDPRAKEALDRLQKQ